MFNNLCSPLHGAEPVQLSPLIESRASVLGKKTLTYPDSTAAGLEYTERWEGKHYTAYEHTPQGCAQYGQTDIYAFSLTQNMQTVKTVFLTCVFFLTWSPGAAAFE